MARMMAPLFENVIGTDPSDPMIKRANEQTPKDKYPNVSYQSASAEDSPFLEAGSVDLVVAAQAAHWFDYPRLFPELSRVVRKGGTLAFFGYKDHVFVDSPRATEILNHYGYGMEKELLGPYWQQPGRSITLNKLRAVQPPESEWEDIQRIEYEPGTEGKGSGEGTMFLSRSMKVGECKGYVRTWSAYHEWRAAHDDVKSRDEGGEGDIVDIAFDEIAREVPEYADMEKEINLEWGSGLILARKR